MSNRKWMTSPYCNTFSTYWWEIFLDPNHPGNTREMIPGYSKKKDCDETQDKERLLMGCMQRLAASGWLEKSLKIEVHKRAGDVIDKRRDPLLFTLYRKEFVVVPALLCEVEFIEFLQKVYKQYVFGESVGELLPKKKPAFSKDDLFRVDLYSFKSMSQLYDQCKKFIRSGHPVPMVDSFYRKYLDRNPHLEQKLF